ncbi:hypothetical protein ACE1B6_24465 [Aerosakkonemataceae cyanobacterium BLCC-F154]|uniref:Uncharacterized protein n=1 Tax=Floridaenema fluviatile BLCC-F154 TaxID=3153640 RepID=A0ABV4YK02_9CYAN
MDQVNVLTQQGITYFQHSQSQAVGVDVKGLSILAGVPLAVIVRLLDSLLGISDTPVPATLKRLEGKVFNKSVAVIPRTAVVDSTAAIDILEYFAFENRQYRNQQALSAYCDFKTIGLRDRITYMIRRLKAEAKGG